MSESFVQFKFAHDEFLSSAGEAAATAAKEASPSSMAPSTAPPPPPNDGLDRFATNVPLAGGGGGIWDSRFDLSDWIMVGYSM